MNWNYGMNWVTSITSPVPHDEAIRTYNKVIKLDPGSGQSYSNLASILVTQERLADLHPLSSGKRLNLRMRK